MIIILDFQKMLVYMEMIIMSLFKKLAGAARAFNESYDEDRAERRAAEARKNCLNCTHCVYDSYYDNYDCLKGNWFPATVSKSQREQLRDWSCSNHRYK